MFLGEERASSKQNWTNTGNKIRKSCEDAPLCKAITFSNICVLRLQEQLLFGIFVACQASSWPKRQNMRNVPHGLGEADLTSPFSIRNPSKRMFWFPGHGGNLLREHVSKNVFRGSWQDQQRRCRLGAASFLRQGPRCSGLFLRLAINWLPLALTRQRAGRRRRTNGHAGSIKRAGRCRGPLTTYRHRLMAPNDLLGGY